MSVVVIKLRNAADWVPTGAGMAVFAGDGDGAVRIVARGFVIRLGERHRQAGEADDQGKPNKFSHALVELGTTLRT